MALNCQCQLGKSEDLFKRMEPTAVALCHCCRSIRLLLGIHFLCRPSREERSCADARTRARGYEHARLGDDTSGPSAGGHAVERAVRAIGARPCRVDGEYADPVG